MTVSAGSGWGIPSVGPPDEPQRVVLVLGCRPVLGERGWLEGALGRRLASARAAFENGGAGGSRAWLLVSGGRTWNGVVEADAMMDDLVRSGVPAAAVVRERCSLTTRDNARLSAQLLRRRGPLGRVTLVTCEWHMARAAALFRREGLDVQPMPAAAPPVRAARRWFRAGAEWLSAIPVSTRGPRT